MRNLAKGFTMRKDRVMPGGEWFTINKAKTKTETNKVYIYDEIGFWGTSASDFVNELKELKGSIDLHLNSPGGEIFDGLAIYNSIKQHDGEVTVYVDGLAASAASFIAQAGSKLVMARNATMMIHDGIAFAYGNEADLLETAEVLSKLSNNIADIYSQAAGVRGSETSLEEFRALMREETWYNGTEARDAGLADEVLDADDEEAQKATNKWDLSFFNFAGRENAESPLRVRERIRLTNQKEKEVDPENNEVTPPEEQPTNEAVAPEAEPNNESAPVAAPSAVQQPVPANSAVVGAGVVINGQRVTDWAVINQHIASLEGSQAEAQTTFRRGAVEKLATENKIPASQIDSLVNLVNGDGDKVAAMSDEQYSAFMASYESLPANPLFENHEAQGEPNSTPENKAPGQPAMSADEKSDRVSVLEGMVAMNSRTMSAEDLKKTPSYNELQSLLGNN